MALQEQRLIQQHTKTLLPQVQADFKQASGGDIEVSVEWEGFESDMAALERLSSQCFDRLVTAIEGKPKDETVERDQLQRATCVGCESEG